MPFSPRRNSASLLRGALVSPLVLSMSSCLAPQTQSPPAAEPQARPASAPGALGVPRDQVMVFLLLGQSNMVGAPAPEPEDQVETPRVRVLAYETCAELGRTYDEWAVAKPPLHGCTNGLGPGDYFAKTLAQSFPSQVIGLVPLAVNGADLALFRKGVVSKRRHEFRIPPDDHWASGYDWILERARLAQRSGIIRGLLFHQGESDTGSAQWPEQVAELVSDLRSDLGLGAVPVAVGELLYSGCCGPWHNPLLPQVIARVPNAQLVSAAGLTGMDAAHFDLPGQRELGRRYAEALLPLLTGAGPGSSTAASP